MITPSLNFGRLFNDALATAKALYVPLLVLGLPGLLLSIPSLLPSDLPFAAAILVLVLALLVAPWFAIASTYLVHRHLTQRRVGVSEALQSTRSKIGQALLCALMLGLIVLPGFVLLVLPGIYLATRFGLALYAIPIENRTAIDALSRSWELVKGRWWSVFFALLRFALVVFFPILVVSTIAAQAGESETAAELIAQLVAGSLSFLVSPLIAAYYVLLFLRLRAAAEGEPSDRLPEAEP